MARRPASIDRRERLIAAGVRAFGQASYEEVSTGRVADDAGVAQGLLFHYFGTKRQFFLEVMRRIMADQQAVYASNRRRDPAAWLRREVELFLAGIAEHPPSRMTAGYAFHADIRAMIEDEQEKTVRRIANRMSIEDPDPLLSAALSGWVAFTLAAGLKWVETPSVPRAQMVDLIAATLNAVLERVAAAEPSAGVDPALFRPAVGRPHPPPRSRSRSRSVN